MERLLKAIVIIHYMLQHRLVVPTKKQLKEYGHDLNSLYSKCVAISADGPSSIPSISDLDQITQEIIQLLSDFAETTRYHNLDALSTTVTSKDPLSHINEILEMIIKSDVPASTVKNITKLRGGFALEVGDIMSVFSQGLDGCDLTLGESFILPALHDKAASFMVLRMVKLLAPLKEFIGDLCQQSYSLRASQPPFPQMDEFLDFLWEDRNYVLRKKRWP
ncbi:hypothetical protein LQR30_15770 [Chromobacterium piscinae]|uniref:hypothetical protein n=1 Tax=Chromobacterium piscinae TaxID=686831 RepID=UPI001E2B7DB5|nr:hypothetical protein [Chromobacterium piscinae]MCD4505557.1 hypothetical protein [Chromobacterium piscinae]